MRDDDKLETEEWLAEVTETSKRTVQGWRVRGDGPPFVKLSRGKRSPVRYRRADVLRWLDEQTRRGTYERGHAA